MTVQIQGCTFPNKLVDLGVSFNLLTYETCNVLGITTLKPTSTLLELADSSVIKPAGTLEDILVSIDSWKYHVDFLVINLRSRLDGHPLILGRPWLATVGIYRMSNWHMTIAKGNVVKNLILYQIAHPSPPAKNLQLHLPRYQEENM